MNTITKTIASLSIAIASFATAAQAQEEVPTSEINLKGYDLTSPAAVDQLKLKIRSSARIVCGMNQIEGLADRQRKMSCYKTAVSTAEAKLATSVALANGNSATLTVR